MLIFIKIASFILKTIYALRLRPTLFPFNSRFGWTTEASGGGRPPPEIGKIVVEIWYYLPDVYTFG